MFRGKSCGCSTGALISAANRTHGRARDGATTKEYHAWRDAIDRCTRPGNPAFKRYGGRGIAICDRWRNDFTAFLADVGFAPSPDHSIDRINVDGNYEPGNVVWSTRKQQARNRRSNRRITHNGETLTLAEWSERAGIHRATLSSRLDLRGWPIEAALTTPVAGAQKAA